VRLKRMVISVEKLGPAMASTSGFEPSELRIARAYHDRFEAAISEDLNTAEALTAFEQMLADKRIGESEKADVIVSMERVLGLNLQSLTRTDLRVRPKAATITEAEIEARLGARKEARAAKDFAKSDALRDELAAQGVEVMDGDPLGWDWKLGE
jgi:cysteinyl-tRNA synthetase